MSERATLREFHNPSDRQNWLDKKTERKRPAFSARIELAVNGGHDGHKSESLPLWREAYL